jgi:two-component system, NtrC family, response regulator HydG
MSTVLVVDDKEMLRDSVGATLARAGMQVILADGGQQALNLISRQRPDAVISDLKMPSMDGLELIEAIRKIDEDLPVVLMTAFGTVETAVKAMKLGAFDYVTKPFEGDELVISVKRAIRHGELIKENAVLRSSPRCDAPRAASGTTLVGLHRLVGESPAMRRVKEQVMAVSESAGTVLICGESGTGKEVVARAVHELSPRDAMPFLGVNCAALSDTLLESELFGHERGAFTGAEKLRKGRFELADRGTLLLDEISEIPSRLQAKLLRVLQERSIERVGSSQSIGVDVRVVATSNRDLPRSVSRGEFRQDLFFRLNVLPIHLPPLRDRLEDVPMLAEHFLRQIGLRDGKTGLHLSDEAMDAMKQYAWPGNVRELQNICERAVVLCRGETIGPELIRPWLGQGLIMMAGPARVLHRETEAAEATGNGFTHHAVYGQAHNGSSSGMSNGLPSAPGNGTSNGHASHVTNGSANGYALPVGPIIHAPAIEDSLSMPLPGSFTEAKPQAVASGQAAADQSINLSGRVLEDIEREAIVAALRRFDGHRQKTAQALGIGVRTLGLKLKKWKSQALVDNTL